MILSYIRSFLRETQIILLVYSKITFRKVFYKWKQLLDFIIYNYNNIYIINLCYIYLIIFFDVFQNLI